MKIYCFVNQGEGTDWQYVIAVCACGDTLAEHVSSSLNWAKHDIGITSDWKHDYYQQHGASQHQGEPYTLEWVDDPRNHEALRKLDAQLEEQKQHSQ